MDISRLVCRLWLVIPVSFGSKKGRAIGIDYIPEIVELAKNNVKMDPSINSNGNIEFICIFSCNSKVLMETRAIPEKRLLMVIDIFTISYSRWLPIGDRPRRSILHS